MQDQTVGKENYKADVWTRWLFVVYLLILFWIILLKLGVQFTYLEKRSLNLVPFITLYLSKWEVLMNVVIFIPLGTYAAILGKKWTIGIHIFSFFVLSFFLESIQYIFRIGTFDVTDLITNTMGAWMGYLLFQILTEVLKDSVKTQLIMNWIGSFGTLLMIILLTFLKLNMLPIRYQ
ncbi:VanZ family protein [Algoriphagus sp. SE2]|uniref:VanZ family protein n=1 Tax=Algoriphagus sp. SE2 TaxID=3141536 RepID=UPI0031CCFAD0